MAGHLVTFPLPVRAYETIMREAVSRGDKSTLTLECREALATAAPLADGTWVVDCTDEISREIEDWFEMAAMVESATPTGDEGRFGMLTSAAIAIRDGRAKSRREKGRRSCD
jgi:hypothetical protein